MKTHRIILFTIFLLGTMVFETKAQTNNMPDRNWSQWSEWNSFECAKKLFFRIRYWEASKELYNWQVEFRNDYSEDLYFNYGLEESYKTHTIYGAESVQPIKANSTYISDNHHYVWQTKTNKFNEVDVYIFHVCIGKSNWEQTYPKYYSECLKKNEKSKSDLWKGYILLCYTKTENGYEGIIEKNQEINYDTKIVFEENLIRVGPNTFPKINEKYYKDECYYHRNDFNPCNVGGLCSCCDGHVKDEVKIINENKIEVYFFSEYKTYYTESEYDVCWRDHYQVHECKIIYTRNHSEIVNEGRAENIEFSKDSNIQIFSGSIHLNEGNESNGIFKDVRDGKEYKTIKIGDQVWMAENLNYSTGNSWCYDNSSSNCNTYGRLYDWETAKNACPSGWHLPSKSEFETLLGYYGEEDRIIYTALILNSNLGFNVQFAGFYDFDGISKYAYHGIGDYNIYWTSTPYNENKMWFLSISRNDENARMNGEFGNLNLGFSVRCIHD